MDRLQKLYTHLPLPPFFPLHLPLSFSRSTHLTLSLSTNATLLLMRRVGNGSSLRGLCCRPSREMATSGTVVHGAISWVIRVGLTPGWPRPAVSVESTNCQTKSTSRTTLRCAAKICLGLGSTGGTAHESKPRS